jgi:hypothetical protein
VFLLELLRNNDFFLNLNFFFFFRSDLTPAEKHTVILTNILRIQKGAGVNELCMNLICKDREVTLKIEDEGIRSLMISGLVALVDRLKRKMNSQKKPA